MPAPTPTQITPGDTSTGVIAVEDTWGQATVDGANLWAFVEYNPLAGTAVVVTPPAGWVEHSTLFAGDNAGFAVYKIIGAAPRSGAEQFGLGDTCDAAVVLVEMPSTAVLDVPTAQDSGMSMTIATGATQQTTVADTYALGWLGNEGPNLQTAVAPWVQERALRSANAANTDKCVAALYSQTFSAQQTVECTATLPSNRDWVGIVAVWREDASGGDVDTGAPTVAIDQVHGTGPVTDVHDAAGYDPATDTLTVTGTAADTAAPSVWRGVNANGGEFGAGSNAGTGTAGDGGDHTFSNANPGTYGSDYAYDTQGSYDYLAGRTGVQAVRLPFRWERIQPTLGAALDATELGHLTDALDRLNTAGLKAIPTVMNYGAYWLDDGGVGVRTTIGTDPVTVAAYADLWGRLATALAGHPALLAYGLMNEPTEIAEQGGGYTAQITHATWDAGIEGWLDEANYDLAHETTITRTGGGSLRVIATRPASGFQGTNVSSATNDQDISAHGDTLGVWVYLPSGQSAGTGHRARLTVCDQSWSWSYGPAVNLIEDEWTWVSYTPPAGHLTANRRLGVSIDTDESNGTSLTVYLDDYTQGSATAATSGVEIWEDASQQAVDAIRAVDTDAWIAVPGYAWSTVTNFSSQHASGPWITDPQSKVVYEAHHYFDNSLGGQYTATYAQEVTNAEGQGYTAGANADALHTRVLDQLSQFTTWLAGAAGYIGEVGVPTTEAEASWNALLDAWYDAADAADLWVTAWASGAWWGGPDADSPWVIHYDSAGSDAIDTSTSTDAVLTGHPSYAGSGGEGAGLESVEVRVDGGTWQPAFLSDETWSIDLDVSAWAAGAHTIEARATDGADNVSTPASVTVWHSPDGIYGAASTPGQHLVPLTLEGWGVV